MREAFTIFMGFVTAYIILNILVIVVLLTATFWAQVVMRFL